MKKVRVQISTLRSGELFIHGLHTGYTLIHPEDVPAIERLAAEGAFFPYYFVANPELDQGGGLGYEIHLLPLIHPKGQQPPELPPEDD